MVVASFPLCGRVNGDSRIVSSGASVTMRPKAEEPADIDRLNA
jgi:hypothetical protein